MKMIPLRDIFLILIIGLGIFGILSIVHIYLTNIRIITKDIPKVISSPIIHRTENGDDVAIKQVILATASQVRRIKTDSAEILRLKQLVRKLSKVPGSTAAEITTITKFDTITYYHDSTPGVFHKTITNKWITANIDGHKDSIDLALDVRNQYEVVFDTKKDTTFAVVKSLNPYTRTTGISAFQVPQKKRTKGAFWLGLVAGAVGGYFILHK